MRNRPLTYRRGLLLFALLLGLSAIHNSRAALGETTLQLDARYGFGKEVGNQILYAYGEMMLTVYRDDKGRSIMEVYGKRMDDKGERAELTEAEVATLLHENTLGRQWLPMAPKGGSQLWRRSDGLALAEYKPKDKAFVIMDVPKP